MLSGALSDRLLDFDDSVRSHAVEVVCDLAVSNLKGFPVELISEATKRLRDKKVAALLETDRSFFSNLLIIFYSI